MYLALPHCSAESQRCVRLGGAETRLKSARNPPCSSCIVSDADGALAVLSHSYMAPYLGNMALGSCAHESYVPTRLHTCHVADLVLLQMEDLSASIVLIINHVRSHPLTARFDKSMS